MADKTLLFHLSDIHFGLEHNRSLDWVAGEIAARKPAAVIITGDLTMRARTREFAAARELDPRSPGPGHGGGGQPRHALLQPRRAVLRPLPALPRDGVGGREGTGSAGHRDHPAQDHGADAAAAALVERLGQRRCARQVPGRDRRAAAGHQGARHRPSPADRGGHPRHRADPRRHPGAGGAGEARCGGGAVGPRPRSVRPALRRPRTVRCG